MSIIVLGNGPSVLNNKYGKYIDKFDEVVRINHYKPEFKEYIGDKLTTYVTTTYNTIFYPKVLKKTNEILILDDINYKISLYDSYEKTKYIDKTLINPYLLKHGFNIIPKKPWATTGIIILLYLIEVKKYNKIIIHGFDNLIVGKKEHCFENNFVNNSPHSSILEKNFINHFINKGIFIKLDDYIIQKNNEKLNQKRILILKR